jgi:phenylacetate-CoA ligase
MTKTDLRDNYPFGLFAVPRSKVARLHASSGTTGKSVVVGYTKNDIDNWANVVARSIRAAGGRAGDMVHVAYGYGMFTGGLGAHYGAERLGCAWCRCPAARPRSRSSRSWTSSRRSSWSRRPTRW